ncbi:hypothetical protein Bhyg_04541 [Pseudolycoriella hygida]|uniref:Uncharacterized protein n=1 Tax=Pseudolycoriella hygida TaxID=35572 RepID=A0A9Q0NFG0_9DIPT|nr:hypothetical protein Bhyg_04541 [Pseudolycoriella hygida]
MKAFEKKMRFFVLIFLVAAVMPMAMGVDIGKLLAAIGPLIKKAKCAAPCIAEAADNVKSCDNGPLKALCLSIDDIVQSSKGCLKKCGVGKKMTKSTAGFLKQLCDVAHN